MEEGMRIRYRKREERMLIMMCICISHFMVIVLGRNIGVTFEMPPKNAVLCSSFQVCFSA